MIIYVLIFIWCRKCNDSKFDVIFVPAHDEQVYCRFMIFHLTPGDTYAAAEMQNFVPARN